MRKQFFWLPFAFAGAVVQADTTINMTDNMKYDPPSVTIKKGEKIQWKNGSAVVHTVTADPKLATDPSHVQLPEGVAPFDSGNIEPEKTYERTFDVAGHYRYFCIPHEAAGMVGEIDVK